jgi:hypothetical protein
VFHDLPVAATMQGACVFKHTVAQLSHANESRHILIKHLETATILLRLTGIPETTRTVEDLQEGIEVD